MFRLILVFYLLVLKFNLYAQPEIEENNAKALTTSQANMKMAEDKLTRYGVSDVAQFCVKKLVKECTINTDGTCDCKISSEPFDENTTPANCNSVFDNVKKQCAVYNNSNLAEKTTTATGKIVKGFMDGLNTTTTAINGIKGVVDLFSRKDDCKNTCREQVAGKNTTILNENFDKYFSMDNKELVTCLCNSNCYHGGVTQEYCDNLSCEFFTDETIEKKTCLCQKLAQSKGVDLELDSKQECKLVKKDPEVVDPDSGFGGDSGPSFGAGKGKEKTADAKKDDKKGAATASAGSAGASGKTGNFNKDNKWKSPYRKDDGIFRTQEGYGRGGGFNQAGRYSNLKPTKDESKFIPKSVSEAAKPKDIFEVKDSIFDEISKTYEDGVTANAFMYLASNEKKTETKNNTKSKRVKRTK